MDFTTVFAYTKQEIIDETIKLVDEKYKISSDESEKIKIDLRLELTDFLKVFVDELDASIEYPYVDKMYRDSYYNYYSFKLDSYPRNSIRISFFDSTTLKIGLSGKQLDASHFLNDEKSDAIQQAYRGYLIIRPTFPRIIGRNVISPLILKDKNIFIRGTEFSSTVAGLKLEVWGFPHSSQDESISCSEATLWACMEYFSNSYPEYKPSLPSNITSVLKMVSFERQIPSNGLTVSQLSYAIREFGFDPKIYTRDKYGDDEFYELFSCYVESGIPIIVAVEGKTEDKRIRKNKIKQNSESTPINDKKEESKRVQSYPPSDDKSTAHAFICIGRKPLLPANKTIIEVFRETKTIYNLEKKGEITGQVTVHDNDEIVKDYVYIDDNFPPYIQSSIRNPKVHKGWTDFKPTHFIVPLYKRVHLTAGEAKELIYQILLNSPYCLKKDSEIFLRVFLTSSRSYKDQIIKNNTLDDFLKQTLLKIALPKFIWVAEISTPELICKNEANGLILLDATEADTKNLKPLIFVLIQNKFRTFAPRFNEISPNKHSGTQIVPESVDKYDLSNHTWKDFKDFKPFEVYSSNLKNISLHPKNKLNNGNKSI